mmetsp:Transcript_89094/g.238609  ORF Transcript_89094/g.238609 Transcript_89094/m.238609 type:complete len:295 (-) Transcript_89094:1287-2171(-)
MHHHDHWRTSCLSVESVGYADSSLRQLTTMLKPSSRRQATKPSALRNTSIDKCSKLRPTCPHRVNVGQVQRDQHCWIVVVLLVCRCALHTASSEQAVCVSNGDRSTIHNQQPGFHPCSVTNGTEICGISEPGGEREHSLYVLPRRHMNDLNFPTEISPINHAVGNQDIAAHSELDQRSHHSADLEFHANCMAGGNQSKWRRCIRCGHRSRCQALNHALRCAALQMSTLKNDPVRHSRDSKDFLFHLAIDRLRAAKQYRASFGIVPGENGETPFDTLLGNLSQLLVIHISRHPPR